MEAALHVNNASGLTFNHAVREAPPETRSSEGGGVWAEYVPTVALKSTLLLLMTSMCLYRSGWGAVATPRLPHWTGAQDFSSGGRVTVHTRHILYARLPSLLVFLRLA